MSADKLWCLYILECADGSLYTGITNDLEKRLSAHNRGVAARYTRARLPVTLRYQEPHADRSAASKREAAVKRLSRAHKTVLIGTRPAKPKTRLKKRKSKPSRANAGQAEAVAHKPGSARLSRARKDKARPAK